MNPPSGLPAPVCVRRSLSSGESMAYFARAAGAGARHQVSPIILTSNCKPTPFRLPSLTLRQAHAPVVVDQADVLVNGEQKSARRRFVGKKTKRRELERAERKVAGGGDRLGSEPRKHKHAARHVDGGGDEQIPFVALLAQQFLHFHGALEGVARVCFADYVACR